MSESLVQKKAGEPSPCFQINELGEVAYLTGSSFTDYIGFLQANEVVWTNNLEDGHSEHQKSLPDLYSFIDTIVEEELTKEDVIEYMQLMNLNHALDPIL